MCLYLRDVSKRVNQTYYKTIVRFVMLYRECVNEFGWLKRRETLRKAGVSEEDDPVVGEFKAAEEQANPESELEREDAAKRVRPEESKR